MRSKKEIIPVISQTDNASKQQKTFNAKIKKINELKTDIKVLEELIQQIKPRFMSDIKPLQSKVAEERYAFVKILEANYHEKFFRKNEKEQILDIMLGECIDLIENHGYADLEALYDRYSEETFKEMRESQADLLKQMTKGMLKDMMGMDVEGLDDFTYDDLKDHSKIFEFMSEKAEQKKQQDWEKENQKKSKPKSKAQQLKEEKAKAEASKLSQTSRMIYSDLVKEFHPDRELDEAKKIEKTAIMQRITEAYNKDDFFTLLQLQIEYLQNDTEHLNQLDDEQLKYYNKILDEQIQELAAHRSMFYQAPPPFDELIADNEKGVERKFRKKIKDLNELLKSVQKTNRDLSSSKQIFRKYLKEQDDDFDDFFQIFSK